MRPTGSEKENWDLKRCCDALRLTETFYAILVFGFFGPLVGLLIASIVSPSLGFLVVVMVLFGLKAPLALLLPLGFAYGLGIGPAVATGIMTVVIRRYKLGYWREAISIFLVGMLLTAIYILVFDSRGKIGEATMLIVQLSIAGGGAAVYCATSLRRHFDEDRA